jgi:phospholipid/cholesterol/gamma-HCH transport system substrate-binding protein
MKRAIKAHLTDFVAILALFVVAGGVSLYILDNQRMRFPLLEPKPFQIKGEFSTGQAVTPGQGQTIRVSGVRVGDISKVELHEGKALITMDLDEEFKGLVKRNWQGLLRPKTGLKDMFIELYPGRESAPAIEAGETIPVSNTLPDVNPDEFFSALDKDTRDYLKLLLNGAKTGLEGRADDLNQVLKRFEPTYRDIARVTSAVATRRQELRRLIRSLNLLNTELGNSDRDLAQLVSASSKVFDAFADEQDNVAATVRELPSALSQTTATLGKVERFAEVLKPAADEIRPAVRALTRANEATLPFAKETAPLLAKDIRPFVRELRPLVRELRPAATDLAAADPNLKRTVAQLNNLFNLLAFNKDGREDPAKADRDEGYLFYLAWLAHQSVQIFSGQDAHGVFRPLVPSGTCGILRNSAESVPGGAFILGLTGLLNDPAVCGGPVARKAVATQAAAQKKKAAAEAKRKAAKG